MTTIGIRRIAAEHGRVDDGRIDTLGMREIAALLHELRDANDQQHVAKAAEDHERDDLRHQSGWQVGVSVKLVGWNR